MTPTTAAAVSPSTALASLAGRSVAAAAVAEPHAAGPTLIGLPVAPALPVVREANLVARVEPAYPVDAAARGTQGVVELSFTVTAAGKVDDVRVMRATPPDTFDRAAVAAVRRWKFEPRTEDGVAVDSREHYRLVFRLAN
jgi:protein TonB